MLDRGNLTARFSIQFVEDERCAEVRWEMLDSAVEIAREVSVVTVGSRIGHGRRFIACSALAVAVEDFGVPFSPAATHPAKVVGDGEKPGGKGSCGAVTLPRPVDFDKSLLRDLMGISQVACGTKAEAYERFFPTPH